MNTTASAASPAPRRTRRRALLILALIVAGAGLGWLAWHLEVGRWREDTEDAYVTGNMVNVMPQTAGTVIGIEADEGMAVQAGQVLVQLDANDAQVAYDRAQADLAATVRQVRGLYDSADASHAQLLARQVAIKQARADVTRREGLVDSGAVSREELAHARDVLAAAEAALSQSRGDLARARALVDATDVAENPQVQAAAAQLVQAYLALQRTVIVAPVAGHVAQRQVQLGQQVQPGMPLLTLVTPEQFWIEANFKETQLRRMRIGQPVAVHADLYGDDVTFHGHVDSLGMGTGSAFSLLPAQNASGNWIKIVQRLPVKIVLDPVELAEHPLRIGLSTRVEVALKDSSGPVLAPARAPSDTPLMSTDAYAGQLDEAHARIARIIRENLPQGG